MGTLQFQWLRNSEHILAEAMTRTALGSKCLGGPTVKQTLGLTVWSLTSWKACEQWVTAQGLQVGVLPLLYQVPVEDPD